MSFIQTVTGKIRPEDIVFCHSHEHLMLQKGQSYRVNPALCMDDYTLTLKEVRDFRALGGSTIVEAQPVGCGRMADDLRALSRDSGVQIIGSTGFHKMIFYPDNHWIFSYSSDQMYRVFLSDLQTGMYLDCDDAEPAYASEAKAGIVKCALDVCGLNAQYKKLFDAAIAAALETGMPFMVHIEPGSDPLTLADYLERRGIDPKRTIFCHMDRACPDLDLHKEICSRGIYLEYDTIGRFKYHDDETEAAIFAEMIKEGYEDQLLFSLDTTRERLKAYTPEGVGLGYIIRTFIPILKEHGISDACIQKMSCSNCRRILAIADTT